MVLTLELIVHSDMRYSIGIHNLDASQLYV